MKSTAILLSLFLFIIPFFQPKKVKAVIGVDDAILAATIATALIAGRYVQTNVLYTPEQMNQINEKWTANLQTAFPDPDDYNHQMNVLQNLNQKLLNGEEVDWSKYSGKALYAVLKGVVDVVWPEQGTGSITHGKNLKYIGTAFGYEYYVASDIKVSYTGWNYADLDNQSGDYDCFVKNDVSYLNTRIHWKNLKTGEEDGCTSSTAITLLVWPNKIRIYRFTGGLTDKQYGIYSIFNVPGVSYPSVSNPQYVPNINAKTANKVKLPTRLPQTVINNINNYIDNSTENLIIAPTTDELPTLPDNYNPVTDDLINLPGYEDVTPDQEPSTDPEPTPTPEPTPEPTPDYNGDRWVNPIGDFMDGLLKFMKAAFVPTLSLNLDALNSMPDNLSEKFPFSLPGDLVRLFGVFQAEPVPFAFDWEMDFTSVGAGKIPIKGDLTMFDKYAPLFRNLAFIAFIIGLAWKTFGMFFGGGDE